MENKIIKTASGRSIEIKQWVSGRDIEYIEQPIQDIRIGIDGTGKIAGEMKAGEAKRESVHRAIERVVISVDGKKEKVLDLVLDLPSSDYREVLSEVDKVVSGDNFTKPVSTQEETTD